MKTDVEITREVWQALGAAFRSEEVGFLPKAQSQGRALALPFIDSRCVMRRLDQAVGPSAWEFDYEVVSADPKAVRVKGKLTVCGVTRCDAGEASDEEEPLKAAVSDALKRCGVHFNIGRYIYELPAVWFPYDKEKRKWTEPPTISRAAINLALEACGIKPLPQEVARERVQAAMEGSGKAGKPALRVERGGGPVVTADGQTVDTETGEVRTDKDASAAANAAVLAAFQRAGLDPRMPGLMQRIANAALGREIEDLRNLGPGPREEIAAWVEAHRDAAQGILTDVQSELAG